MAFTFDTNLRFTGSSNPLTSNYTCGSGSTILVLSIVVAGSTNRTGGAPTYNGIEMHRVDTQTATETNCEMWYCDYMTTGSAKKISIPNAGTLNLYVQASTYKGEGKALITGFSATQNTGANPSVSVTTVRDGSVIVAVLGDGYSSAPSGRTGTSLNETDNGDFSDNNQYYLQASAGSWTAGWTVSSDDYCIIAVKIEDWISFSGSGTGTSADPYIITTPQELDEIRCFTFGKYIELGNDIDLDVAPYNIGAGWRPIGDDSRVFSYIFDGKNYTIDNLFIDRPEESNAGFIGRANNSSSYIIRNINFTNADVTGYIYVGIFFGSIGVYIINNCSVDGSVDGSSYCGGFLGYKRATGTNSYISRCYSKGSVYGSSYCGGFFGASGIDLYCFGCYSESSVETTVLFAGGFGGDLGNTYLEQCYSVGAVTNGGGFGGYRGETTRILKCYFDTDTTGTTWSSKGIGKTTIEMKKQKTFEDWSWGNIWEITEDTTYPQLLQKDFHILTSAPTLNSETPETVILKGTYFSNYDDIYVTRKKCGFVYDTISYENPETTLPENSEYANYVEDSSPSTYTFDYTITNFNQNQHYYYRSFWIDNNDTIVYGDEYEFSTYYDSDNIIFSNSYDEFGELINPGITLFFN
jgi:hypothetical protein